MVSTITMQSHEVHVCLTPMLCMQKNLGMRLFMYSLCVLPCLHTAITFLKLGATIPHHPCISYTLLYIYTFTSLTLVLYLILHIWFGP